MSLNATTAPTSAPIRVRTRPLLSPVSLAGEQLRQVTESSALRLPPARARTRPQLFTASTGDEAPPVKRGRGRPRKHPRPPEGAIKKEYEVGYGKPPVATRFKKGQSGNPSGRAKGLVSIDGMFEEALQAPITARINGKTLEMSTGRAIVESTVRKALDGDHRSREHVFKRMDRFDAQRSSGQAFEADDLAARARDEELAEALLDRYGWGSADDKP